MDMFATLAYRREVGGPTITVNFHLNDLYLFMGVEKASPQERIRGLDEEGAAGVLDPGTSVFTDDTNPGIQHADFQDEVSTT